MKGRELRLSAVGFLFAATSVPWSLRKAIAKVEESRR